eukprot:COSAG05_NODE_20996_length_275_cov_0.590909_2_plen_32_part_01
MRMLAEQTHVLLTPRILKLRTIATAAAVTVRV